MNRLVSSVRIWALFSCLLAAGCASQTQIAQSTTTYNKAIEQTNNEELLLNILRASQRRPMYFSYLTQLHGGAGLSLPSAALSWPFGPSGPSPAQRSLSATLGYVSTTGTDVGVLDSKEFARGFTTPVDMKTIAYHWDQGWPRELLWFLFVKKIHIKFADAKTTNLEYNLKWGAKEKDLRDLLRPLEHDAECPLVLGDGKEGVTFLNYPPDRDELCRFKHVSRVLLGSKFALAPKSLTSHEMVGPPLALDSKDRAATGTSTDLLEQLVAIGTAKDLSLEKTQDGRYQLQRSAKTFSLWYPGGCGDDSSNVTTGDTAAGIAGTDQCHGAQELNISIRSPEAILFYLGEIARFAIHGEKNWVTVNICESPKVAVPHEAPFFGIERLGEGHGPTVVEVEFDGSRYGIPRSSSSEPYEECIQQSAMNTLALVGLLIDAQKSEKDLPTPNVVRVVE